MVEETDRSEFEAVEMFCYLEDKWVNKISNDEVLVRIKEKRTF